MQTASNVFNKKMTRAEFLKYFGLMIVSVLGISTMFKNLTEFSGASRKNKLSSSEKRTFGGGAYGV